MKHLRSHIFGFKGLIGMILSSFSLIFCACSGNEAYRSAAGMVWNTTFHITWNGAAELQDSIHPVLERVGASLNAFDSTSLVSRANRVRTLPVDSDFIRVHEASVMIHRISAGAFDPTLAPLIRAWGFGQGHTPTGDTLRLDSLLDLCGLGKTQIKGGVLVKERKETEFNFSAIAKGYGADCVGRMFERNGVEDYMVEIGGEIACSGLSPRGGKWRVSIDRPIVSDSVLHESQCIIAVSNCGVATSGNYRNFHRDRSGSTFGHTISAVSGRAVKSEVLSATVIAPTAMLADGYATALMAMPIRQGRRMARDAGLAAMIITADSVWLTPEFENLLLTP